jgi:hypothetical protein
MPSVAEFTQVGTQVHPVVQPGLEAGPVGIGLGSKTGLRFSVGPPMRESGATGLGHATGPTPAGHRRYRSPTGAAVCNWAMRAGVAAAATARRALNSVVTSSAPSRSMTVAPASVHRSIAPK